MAERVGFEPTVGYKPTPIFKTGAINQLDHLSIIGYDIRNSIYNNTFYLNMSIVLTKKVRWLLQSSHLKSKVIYLSSP